MENQEMNIEEAFDALEKLVEKMESGEASLEETFLMIIYNIHMMIRAE